MCLHEVDNPHLEVFKNVDLHSKEEFGVQKVTHDTETISKHLDPSVHIA
jgi:hypothetical protein